MDPDEIKKLKRSGVLKWIYEIRRPSKKILFLLIVLFIILAFTLTKLIEMRAKKYDVSAYIVQSDHGPDLKRLPDLTTITWPRREFASDPFQGDIIAEKPFEPHVSEQQYDGFFRVLRTLAKVMEDLGHSDRWFMHGETLLGSIRQHDVLAWDDDVDIMVEVGVRNALRAKLLTVFSTLGIISVGKNRDLIQMNAVINGRVEIDGQVRSENHTVLWPSVYLCYYELTDIRVKELEPLFHKYSSFSRSDVFPLLYRPFGKLWLPSPYKPLAFLQNMFPYENLCSTHMWSEASNHRLEHASLPCKSLANRYSFVQLRELAVEAPKESALTMMAERLVILSGKREKIIHEIPVAVIKEKTNFLLH